MLLALTLPMTASAETKGPNGGIVVKVDDHPVELVHRGQEIVFYVGDHHGKPQPTKGLQARAIVQDGGQTKTVVLTPRAPNLFVGTLSAPLSADARIVFSTWVDGHGLQVRFTLK
jgi:hypothetical protein